jgi:hypothetical protein
MLKGNVNLFRVRDVTLTTAIFSKVDNVKHSSENHTPLRVQFPMNRMPDGIVTVHLDGERYRGAYCFRGDELVVNAYGLQESSASMAILQGERGKAALNLAKLVLIDMVRNAANPHGLLPPLSLQGSTTHISLQGSTTQISF